MKKKAKKTSPTEDKKSEFPKDACPAGGGNMFGFTVEGRNNFLEPITLGNQTFDKRWKKVQFNPSVSGVPTRKGNAHDVGTYGLMDYAAAQALRWWVLAELKASLEIHGLCFETRLVQHEIKYEYSVTPISSHEYVGGDGGSISAKRPAKENQHDNG